MRFTDKQKKPIVVRQKTPRHPVMLNRRGDRPEWNRIIYKRHKRTTGQE